MHIQESGVRKQSSLFKTGALFITMYILTLGLRIPQANAEIPRIIFDSDMSSDHDDAADIAVLNALADLGECEILACMASSQNGATALAFNSINTYYGRPNVPCGRRPDCGGIGMYPGNIASEWPHPLYATYLDPPLAVNLYRQVLAAQPDHSVSIVTTGYLNNLMALMQSGPDQYSPLNGMDLIRQKVKLLSCAGGCYPSGDEFNFRVEPTAASYVINNWPTAAFFDGYDVGSNIYSGGGLQSTPTTNPIRRCFELTSFGPYPTWGQLMIYYAVRTAESQTLWKYNTTGHNNVDANGHNWWSTETDPSGAQEQGYMLEIERYPIQTAIDTLVMNSGAPKSKGTVSPPNQPSNLRATVVGGNRIDLQWTDNSWNETGFTIERKINGVFTQIGTVGANVTTYSDKGLSSTTNCAYRVKAYNAIGSSAYYPITVYSGWTEINFDNPSNLPLYTYYQYDNLRCASGGNGPNHVTLNNDSLHGKDVTISVDVCGGGYGSFYVYFFYQDANNWYRLSVDGSSTKFQKSINGTISQVGSVGSNINIGDGSLMQTWQIVVTHLGTLQFINNGSTFLNVSDTLSFSSGKIGLGGVTRAPVWQNFSFDTGSGGAPTAPMGLAATAGNTQVSLNWTASLSATSYNVYRGTSAGGESTTPIATGITAATYTNTGLTNGTAYYYKVAAVNNSGTSGYSNEASATPASGGGPSIGVQFVGPGTALASTDSAGVSTVAQTHWNALFGFSFSNQALVDSSGSSTTARLAGGSNWIYLGGGSTASPVGNAKLASGELINSWPGGPTLTVSNIPYAQYDVYVYAAVDATGRIQTVSVTPSGGAAQYFSFLTMGGGSAWTAATSTWNGSGTPPTLPSANYARFSGLTASSFTMAWGSPGNGGLNGIQIVPVGSGGTAPGITSSLTTSETVGSGTALASTNSAGVSTVAQTHWNALFGFSFSNQALVDSSGSSTTARLAGSAIRREWI